MKKNLYFALSFFFSLTLHAQKVEFFGGYNRNNFFDYEKNSPNTVSEYNGGDGFSLGFSISDIQYDSIPLKFTLNFDNYKGGFSVTNGGMGGASTTTAQVRKNTLGLGLYPFNFKLFNKVEFNLGGEFGFLVSDVTTGKMSSWTYGGSEPGSYKSTLTTIDNHAERINNSKYFGFCGIVSYHFKISEKWLLSPQYKFYYGIKNDFKAVEASIKSLRNNFSIGISRVF